MFPKSPPAPHPTIICFPSSSLSLVSAIPRRWHGCTSPPLPYANSQSPFPIKRKSATEKEKKKVAVAAKKSRIDFTKINQSLLSTVIIIDRPNVGISALFNCLIRRRKALVYNTPDDHITRDIHEGAKLGDLRFSVFDLAGLEMVATSGTILNCTTVMTGNVLARSQFVIFLIDFREMMERKNIGHS